MRKKSTDELLKLIQQENKLESFLQANADEFEHTTLCAELNRLLIEHSKTKAAKKAPNVHNNILIIKSFIMFYDRIFL